MNELQSIERGRAGRCFQTAWVALLDAQRVSQHNIGQLPTLPVTALLNAASNGEHDEEKARSYGFESPRPLRTPRTASRCTK
jgi:hypothetical protein